MASIQFLVYSIFVASLLDERMNSFFFYTIFDFNIFSAGNDDDIFCYIAVCNFWYRMKHVFTNHLKRPVVLCMVGHSSHLSYKTLLLAKDHDVILVALPPNTSHALQLFDVAVFFLS